MKKKQSQKVHFKRRFKERVGYEITEEKFNFIKKNITKDGKHLYNADGNGVYRFSLDGIDLKIVYNITNNSLVTILPP